MEGFYVKDYVRFGDDFKENPPFRGIFGCSEKVTNLFKS